MGGVTHRTQFLGALVNTSAGAGENDLRSEFCEKPRGDKPNAFLAPRSGHDGRGTLEREQWVGCHDSSIGSGALASQGQRDANRDEDAPKGLVDPFAKLR